MKNEHLKISLMWHLFKGAPSYQVITEAEVCGESR